jgi:hypothetical protein
MEKISLGQIFLKPNWRWIVVAFCFFVLFHLLLLFFLTDKIMVVFGKSFWPGSAVVISFLAFVSMYIGYRARGFVLIEPAIAATLYILTLKMLLPSYLAVPIYLQNIYFTIECTILGFVFAFGGTGIGWWIKQRRQMRQKISVVKNPIS